MPGINIFDFLTVWIKVAVILTIFVVFNIIVVISIGDEYQTYQQWKERPYRARRRKSHMPRVRE